MQNIRELAHKHAQYVIDLRHDFHKHPEKSMEEYRTTGAVAAELEKMGIPFRVLEPSGVIAEIKGAFPGKTIGLRADMDALSITEKTDVPFKSVNDGFMHACGHDTHTAMLLGAAKILDEIRGELHGTVRLVFQPGEEVAQGAKSVIDQKGIEGVDAMFGIHIGAQRPVGHVFMMAGASAAACDEWILKIKGRAGHGAAPEACVDATVCAAAIIMNLQTIVSREVAAMKPLVVTVGKLETGTRFNIVSGEAVMTGTNRSFDYDLHHALPGMMERIVKGTCDAYRCDYELTYNMLTEVLANDADMTELAKKAAAKITDTPECVEEATPGMGGEDFAEYTHFCPSAFANLGAGGEYPHHSDFFWVDESSFEVGSALYAQVAVDYLNQE
ncbi:MAG: amidohydrolase [Solobacterium sp.]|nr:amidohydrolase [Solobacterium sp.]